MPGLIKVRKLTHKTVWKLVFIGTIFSFMPLGFIAGFCSLGGINFVTITEGSRFGLPVYGLKGLAIAVSMFSFLCLFLIIVEGISLSAGLWLYSKFRPINIQYEYELEAEEVKVEVVENEASLERQKRMGFEKKDHEKEDKALKEAHAERDLKALAAYIGKGQYEQAISDYNKAIELNPSYAEAYYNRGLAWKMKGDFDQALADARKALSLKPTNKLLQSFVTELENEIKRKK